MNKKQISGSIDSKVAADFDAFAKSRKLLEGISVGMSLSEVIRAGLRVIAKKKDKK